MKNKHLCKIRIAVALVLIVSMALLSACERGGAVSPTPTPDATPDYRLSFDATGYAKLSDNEYIFDDLLFVSLQDFPKQTSAAYDEEAMEARIRALMGDDIRIDTLTLSEEHSEQLSYPVWGLVYETGNDEDTMLCVDLYFQTDTREYLVHTSTPADYALGYRDDFDDYDDLIEALLASVELVPVR